MSISSRQSTIKRYRKEINDLSTKIADKRKHTSEAEAKANKAVSDARKSKFLSTVRSKIAESERYAKEATKYQKEMADLERKRAEKEKLLLTEEKKLIKEQESEEKKRQKAQQKVADVNERKMKSLTQTVKSVQIEQSKMRQIYPLLKVSSEEAYDVFISYASEDKVPFVDSLVEVLLQRGVKVWYDRKILTWGRSIRQNIDLGLRQSKFAIIVLSEFYIQKYWTQKEFNALFSLGSQLGEFLLPIWHNITPERAKEFSPMLSDAIALISSNYTIEEIADMFVEKLNYVNNG
ncbi:TIR domain-containing protein [uncultured Muribaculum sp.]|uniref:TIR domain-containing protein n=1 Tax=uncultured Muribaculum sp. TaxID=1918613 RepID=UPI0025B126C7|nr:TIR domain-containing protein [uncultured Muribaculum sp.]